MGPECWVSPPSWENTHSLCLTHDNVLIAALEELLAFFMRQNHFHQASIAILLETYCCNTIGTSLRICICALGSRKVFHNIRILWQHFDELFHGHISVVIFLKLAEQLLGSAHGSQHRKHNWIEKVWMQASKHAWMRKKIFFNYFGAMPCRCSMPAGDYIWYQKGTSAHSSRSNIQDSTRRNAQDQFWNFKRLDGRISHEEYFRLSPIFKHLKGQLGLPVIEVAIRNSLKRKLQTPAFQLAESNLRRHSQLALFRLSRWSA